MFFFLIQNNGQNAYCKDVSIPNFGVTARSISIKKSGSRTSEITYHSQQIEWTGSSLGGREKSWRIWRRGVDSGARSFLSLVPQPQQRTWASTPALHALHDGVLSQHSAPGLVRSCKNTLCAVTRSLELRQSAWRASFLLLTRRIQLNSKVHVFIGRWSWS
jgi:hypothetical protein